MFCHNCGLPQSDDAAFCAQCGARQTLEVAQAVKSTEEAPHAERAASAEGTGPKGLEGVAPARPKEQLPSSENPGSITNFENARPSSAAPEPASFRPEGQSRTKAGIILLWVVTVAWVSLVALHAYANWPMLSRLDINELTDFVLRAVAPIVAFWLVMGYFQLAARLRSSETLHLQAERLVAQNKEAVARVNLLASQAQAAVATVEGEIERLRDHEKARARAMQPRWEVNGCIAHEKVYEINLRNAGAAASGVNAVWDKSARMAVLLSDTTFVDRGSPLTIKVMFLDARLDQFELKLQYCDGADQPRAASMAVSNMEVTIQHDAV